MTADRFHLGWFLGNSYGVHAWNQQWAGTGGRDWAKPDMAIDLARSLERACCDFLLMEDSLFVPDDYGGSMDHYLRNAARAPKNDPMPLVPLLLQATRHLGIVPTASTSFYPPYLLARLVATFDLMSDGRAGCNLVTSTSTRAAQNFGLDDHIEHDTRYEMAAEFVEVMCRLWESWEADALVVDREAGVFADPAKVHTIDFEGRFFRSRGPLNTARPPQGRPVLVQAGGSPSGRSFAAEHADAIITTFNTPAEMKAFRDDIHERLISHGRKPSDCKIMFVASPTLGETMEEARERHERRNARVSDHPESTLASMASLTNIDFAKFDLDEPLEELTTNGQQGTLKQFQRAGRTLREIAANYRYGLQDIWGTPDAVASQLVELMQEVGGDGFMFSAAGALTRRYVTEIADGVVPELQRRGVVRTAYTYDHFRDNLFEF